MPEQPFDPIPTRHSLLNRLKDWGDQTSWQEFFDTYVQLIYNVAVKAGLSHAEAQEAVQETVITVARNMADFKTGSAHGSFSAWLMQLTRWRIADQFRKRQKEASFVAAGVAPLPPSDDTSTDPMERIPDPATLPLETLWQEEWKQHLMTAALE